MAGQGDPALPSETTRTPPEVFRLPLQDMPEQGRKQAFSVQLLQLLDEWVGQCSKRQKQPRSAIRFTQRELREALGWGDFQLRRQLARLLELEYVLADRTGRGNGRQYELVYHGQGQDGRPFLLGLTDAETLQADCTSSPPEV